VLQKREQAPKCGNNEEEKKIRKNHSLTQSGSEGPQSRQTVNMAMSPMGVGNKNHGAGEGQQQFSSQSLFKALRELKNMIIK
jgi:hypothetical protein